MESWVEGETIEVLLWSKAISRVWASRSNIYRTNPLVWTESINYIWFFNWITNNVTLAWRSHSLGQIFSFVQIIPIIWVLFLFYLVQRFKLCDSESCSGRFSQNAQIWKDSSIFSNISFCERKARDLPEACWTVLEKTKTKNKRIKEHTKKKNNWWINQDMALKPPSHKWCVNI